MAVTSWGDVQQVEECLAREAIVVGGGKVVWSASHGAITRKALSDAWRSFPSVASR